MAAISSNEDFAVGPPTANASSTSTHLESSSNPLPIPPVIDDTTPVDSKEPPVTAAESSQLPESSQILPVLPDAIIPSYSRWFSLDSIHDCEIRFLSEFFDGRSPSKTPVNYMYCRNSIVQAFRKNPRVKITFTEVRKMIIGDVGTIRRVFDFLDDWGLINYTGAAIRQPLKWEDKEKKHSQSGAGGDVGGNNSVEPSSPAHVASKKFCNACKSLCTTACFTCDKIDSTLCSRCFACTNYRVGGSPDDFKRVQLSDESKTNWSETETLRLFEALMIYSDDWKKVSQHVGGGRSDKDCVARVIGLPFGDQFVNGCNGIVSDSKIIRLTPLADASNPIMAQVAFLAGLAGEEMAKSAAQAAIKSLGKTQKEEATPTSMESAEDSDAEKEEKTISDICEVQMKEILEKIVGFQELELKMEKGWKELHDLKNELHSFHKTLAE